VAFTPLSSSAFKLRKLIFSVTRFSIDHWHNCLGHPTHDIIIRIIRENKLSYASLDSLSSSICDPCLRAKTRHLPYSLSSSHATTPLELIHSDVWDPAIQSFGRKKYYVSFIDGYSKFTWIYLLCHKSEVFQHFLEFQSLVERRFNRKIITVQSDWRGGVSMRDYILFSSSRHLSSCLLPSHPSIKWCCRAQASPYRRDGSLPACHCFYAP
jgi:hypothetical protein